MKKIIYMGMMGFSVMLLFYFLISGMLNRDNKESDSVFEAINQNEDDEQFVISDTVPEKKEKEEVKTEAKSKEKKDNKDPKEKEDVPYITEPKTEPQSAYEVKKKEDLTGFTMADLFKEEDLEVTSQMAIEFASKFHSYDSENPKQNIEDVVTLLYGPTYDFFMQNEQLKVTSIYDIEGITKREVLSAEIIESDTPYPNDIYWNVEVTSKVLKEDGSEIEEVLMYNMLFEKNNLGQFGITDFFIQ